VRTPAVDAPVSTLSGAGPAGSSVICSFFGSTTPFPGNKLVALYHDKRGYLAAFSRSLDGAIPSGYILSDHRAAMLAQAEAVAFPSART
jgi:hypothetical protein